MPPVVEAKEEKASCNDVTPGTQEGSWSTKNLKPSTTLFTAQIIANKPPLIIKATPIHTNFKVNKTNFIPDKVCTKIVTVYIIFSNTDVNMLAQFFISVCPTLK